MANLSEALDAALAARFMAGQPRRPATHRQGLTARMNQLEKQFTGDRRSPGRRAAEAAGISHRTWQKWRAGTQRPGPALLRKLETAYNRIVALPKFRRKVAKEGIPNTVRVSAIIDWNGYKNRTEYRTVDLGGMRSTMARVIRVWGLAGPEAAAEMFEQGAATANQTGYIKFEGDQVEVEFPWE